MNSWGQLGPGRLDQLAGGVDVVFRREEQVVVHAVTPRVLITGWLAGASVSTLLERAAAGPAGDRQRA